MTDISLNVELPAHSHSFQVQVSESASIANIKFEISKSCPGEPKVEGQRLIYAGRLLRDDENIQDIWPVSTSHATPRHSCWLLISGARRLRALNSRERFIWPCIRQLGRLTHPGGVLHHSSRSPRPAQRLRSRLHPTRHQFIYNTSTGNRTSSLSTNGHSPFFLPTLRQKSRCSISTASTPISKRRGLSYSIVAGLGPPFSMRRSLPSLPASNTNE